MPSNESALTHRCINCHAPLLYRSARKGPAVCFKCVKAKVKMQTTCHGCGTEFTIGWKGALSKEPYCSWHCRQVSKKRGQVAVADELLRQAQVTPIPYERVAAALAPVYSTDRSVRGMMSKQGRSSIQYGNKFWVGKQHPSKHVHWLLCKYGPTSMKNVDLMIEILNDKEYQEVSGHWPTQPEEWSQEETSEGTVLWWTEPSDISDLW